MQFMQIIREAQHPVQHFISVQLDFATGSFDRIFFAARNVKSKCTGEKVFAMSKQL